MKDVSTLVKIPTADRHTVIMSPKAAFVPCQHRDGSEDGSDDGSDHEEVPMIKTGSSPRSRKWRGNLKMAIAILGFLLLASLAGNAILLSDFFLPAPDLDAISVKHTSEYCR